MSRAVSDAAQSPGHHITADLQEHTLNSSVNTPTLNGLHESSFQFAYDDEPQSDLEQAYQTPPEEDEDGTEKAKVAVRPRELHYTPYMTLQGHQGGVAQVRYSPDGRGIASCGADATIKIWSAHNGELLHTLEGHLAGVSTIAWSPDSKVLASGSDDKLIRLWDVQSGKCLPQPLVGHHNYVYSMAFSPKGNMLVSGSYDEAVFLWDVRTARLMRSLPAHSDPVSGVDFVRDGTLIASCSTDGLIRIWDTATGQCLKTLVHEDNAPVTSVQFSPNGKYVLATTLDSSVRLWNYVEGRCLKTYQGHKNEKFSMNTAFGLYGATGHVIAQHSQPRWAFVACGSEDGRIVLWDVSSKEILQEISGHDGAVLGLSFCQQTEDLVSCGSDTRIRIWRREATNDQLPESNGVTPAAIKLEDDGNQSGLRASPAG